MTARPLSSSAAPHAEYRRRARRIRSVFATAPAMRIHALRELAHKHDRIRLQTRSNPVVTLPEGAAGRFAHAVRERMDGPVLRYSHRTRLIRQAEQRGIGRFEANLIIAAVQHEVGAERPKAPVKNVSPAWVRTALAFATMQSIIATAVWWIIG